MKTIRKQGSIRAGDRAAAAVSGGADSVALLRLLLELRAELGIVVSVAHINHKLRGEESDEDELFVAELARQHGIELHVCKASDDGRRSSKVGSGIGAENGSGVEAAARELRYGFFRELAREGRVAKIVTAHTLDDQAETVLQRIFRGTGIRGLAGIHPRIVFEEQGREFGEVLRPLLGFRREVLREFLSERGQRWREDSSNRDDAFLRNRVRHRLLPIIGEEFGGAAIEHMSELAEIARAEEEHWERAHPEIAAQLTSGIKAVISSAAPLARLKTRAFKAKSNKVVLSEAVSGKAKSNKAKPHKANSGPDSRRQPDARRAASLPATGLLALSLAAQRRLVYVWLEANVADLSISFRLIEEVLELARGLAGQRLELTTGHTLRVTRQRGRKELLLEVETADEGKTADYEYALAVPGAVEVPELGAWIEARLVEAGSVPEGERGRLLDLERVPKEVLIRNWRAGDRYWPAHTSSARKVKELLGDRQAAGAEKKLWPVAVAEGCGLVWMRGFAVPAAFRVPAGAAKAIWIREIAGMM